MKRDYLDCPHCGKSDPNDNIVTARKILYCCGSEISIVEKRKCDICGKTYEIVVHYDAKYEEYMLTQLSWLERLVYTQEGVDSSSTVSTI